MAGLLSFPLVCPFLKNNAHIFMLCKQEEVRVKAGEAFFLVLIMIRETKMLYLSYISAKHNGFESCLMIIHRCCHGSLSYSLPSYCLLMMQNYPEFILKHQTLTIIRGEVICHLSTWWQYMIDGSIALYVTAPLHSSGTGFKAVPGTC